MKLPNIHAYETDTGTQYAVCIRDERAANWYRPLDYIERRAMDCSYEYSRTLETFGGFSLPQASGRARTLYGYARIQR